MENIKNNKLTYISLFSSAGVGCYGFKIEGFECVATNELIERRLRIQEANNKCKYKSGYILGDITLETTKERIFDELKMWKNKEKINEIDVLIATPPCQGMSVANHKKNNEKTRNSLVVESIKMIKEIKPKIFIFENVRAFLGTDCIDIDGRTKKIKDAIYENLDSEYKIDYKVLNFKNYGGISSRTRTLVIGVKSTLESINPVELFPQYEEEKTLRQVIGHLKPLNKMSEMDKDDIYHHFRKYDMKMLDWIKDTQEGKSAFDNINPNSIPHRVEKGQIIFNKNSNADKYTRQMWNKVAPCIHTRNDLLASQNTVHPKDNRVFSIRELMKMMSVPDDFKWTDVDEKLLNSLSEKEKLEYLKKNEINIRQSLGEAVPTGVFNKIAKNIKRVIVDKQYTPKEIINIINTNKLKDIELLKKFIKDNIDIMSLNNLYKIVELSNCNREKHAAFYTDLDLCENIVRELPELDKDEINILEPSAGVGNFIYFITKKYEQVPKVNIDIIDIDKNMLEICEIILSRKCNNENINFNYINEDYLLYKPSKRYDIIIGNPPFDKLSSKTSKLEFYKNYVENKNTNNIFAFFLEKAINESDIVSLITPKSLLGAPEFNVTRDIINNYRILIIHDFGEYGFKGIKIETINIIVNTKESNLKSTKIISYINKTEEIKKQKYITDKKFKTWLLYRNEWFDEFTKSKKFGVFEVFRDRQITKNMLDIKGKYRVLKSRNIDDCKIKSITGYDQYITNIDALVVKKYMNNNNLILVPNLTYNPRACFMPKDSIPNGSVAILIAKDQDLKISEENLKFFATNEFKQFYKIARNYGTRSLNIDSNSVKFFCIKEEF